MLFDLIPIDITLHVLMYFGIIHMLICFFPQSCVDLDFDINLDNLFVSHFGVLSSWFT